MTDVDDGIKHFLDWLSLSTVVTTLMGFMPSLAAILPIVWYGIRIYETKTFQDIIKKYLQDEDEF
jgi:hypothetical protein